MEKIKKVLTYLKKNHLILSTAESCTGGQIIHLLAQTPGSGVCMDTGFVVYSAASKKRVLKVKQKTIDAYTLSSEEVAREMILGALEDSGANVAVSTTGVAGGQAMDGVSPGTVCFGWGFKLGSEIITYSETMHFKGSRANVINEASEHALVKISALHASLDICSSIAM